MSRVRSTTDAENSADSSFAEKLPFQSSLWHRHDGSAESVGSRKPNPNIEHCQPDGETGFVAKKTNMDHGIALICHFLQTRGVLGPSLTGCVCAGPSSKHRERCPELARRTKASEILKLSLTACLLGKTESSAAVQNQCD